MIEHAESEFGMKLRRLREERGVSLRQIADVTKVSVSVLEALERNNLSRLPGGIYGRAVVRSYASEIGLDPEQTVRDFLSQFSLDSVAAVSPRAMDQRLVHPFRRGGSSIVVVAISVVIGLIVLLTLALAQ